MPHGVHAKDQVNIRFPPEILARLKDGAKRHGETQTDIVVRGTAAELDRLDAERTRMTGPAHKPTCKCGVCKPEGDKR